MRERRAGLVNELRLVLFEVHSVLPSSSHVLHKRVSRSVHELAKAHSTGGPLVYQPRSREVESHCPFAHSQLFFSSRKHVGSVFIFDSAVAPRSIFLQSGIVYVKYSRHPPHCFVLQRHLRGHSQVHLHAAASRQYSTRYLRRCRILHWLRIGKPQGFDGASGALHLSGGLLVHVE